MNKINDIKEICETYVEVYKSYPQQIKDVDQAIVCGMAIAAETILEILNEEI